MNRIDHETAEKLRDLVLASRKTAKDATRAIGQPDEAKWQVAAGADDKALEEVLRFIRALEHGEAQS